MPIEIRELVIKVKVEEEAKQSREISDITAIQRLIETTCKREVSTQLNKLKER